MQKLVSIFIILLSGMIFVNKANANQEQVIYSLPQNFEVNYKTSIKKGNRYIQSLFYNFPQVLNVKAISGNTSTAAYNLTDNTYEINMSKNLMRGKKIDKNRDYIIWHEIGHVVTYAGLHFNARKILMQEFKKSKNWKNCFKMEKTQQTYLTACMPPVEIIADQIAYYAIDKKQDKKLYKQLSSEMMLAPRLITNKKMEQLLKQHYDTNLAKQELDYLDFDNQYYD